MIVTLTPNPSIDATLLLRSALEPGEVQRAEEVSQVAGGKGVNVAHAAHLAGAATLAIFPAAHRDPFISLVNDTGVPYLAVPMSGSVRVNTTLTDPTGTTTKVNGPGPVLSADNQRRIVSELAAQAGDAAWVVLAGSLPRGVPSAWYTDLVGAVRAAAPAARIAVDTSDTPMIQLGKHLAEAAPDLIKPNGFELGQLSGTDGAQLEASAQEGDFEKVTAAAQQVVSRGIDQVLVTLGSAGAVLVTPQGAWAATPPPVSVRSTVGAGDSSLAGYILARSAGMAYPEALAQSVAYGTAAAGLPGTSIPRPSEINVADTVVTELKLHAD